MALVSCDKSDVAGTTTETISGKTTGIIHLADGKPAAGAKVRVYPVGYRPLQDSDATAAFKTSTDDNGRYYIDSLEAQEYNILSDLKGQAGYLDSVSLSGTGRNLASLTLEDPGILCGRIALQSGDLPSAASVQIMGTQAFANVDDDGFFELPALAPGRYRAAIGASLENYTLLFATVDVRSGRRDTLADTLRPKFTGIPQVAGLKASFDTLHQQVRLSWSKSRYPNLGDYVLFRDRKGTVRYSVEPFASTRDTVYVDHLDSIRNSNFGLPVQEPAWEYRVALRDPFRNVGRSFGTLLVETPPAFMVTTGISVTILNTAQGTASILDTAYLVADFGNPTHGLKLLRWFQEGRSAPLRSVALHGQSGSDTLMIICPGQPGVSTFRAEVAEENGMEYMAMTGVQVVFDQPIIEMDHEAFGSAGEAFHLHATVRDGMGRVVGMEWDIGNTGHWAKTPSNDTTVLLPDQATENYLCLARVTDDDGLTAVDSIRVHVSPWRSLPPMPVALNQHAAAALGNTIYVMGGRATGGFARSNAYAYDTATRTWSEIAPMLAQRTNFPTAVLNGRIYVFGGKNGSDQPIQSADVYDPATKQWTALPRMPGARYNHVAFVKNGLIYLLGGVSYGTVWDDRMKAVDVFDPADGSWSAFNTNIPFERDMKVAVAGNDCYLFSTHQSASGKFARFDPVANLWGPTQSIPIPAGWSDAVVQDFAVQGVGDRIALLGGNLFSSRIWEPVNIRDSYVFDPAAGTWESRAPMRSLKTGQATVQLDGFVYMLGGVSGEPATAGQRLNDAERMRF